MESPVTVREAICEGDSAGQGLFISQAGGVEVGTLLTRYPGKPKWFKTKRNGDIDKPNKYTISMGIFKVVDENGRRIVYRALAWDVPIHHVPESTKYVGHLVNTSVPRCLDKVYRAPNSVWGFRIIRMELDCRVEPNVELWLISAAKISKTVQVLVDYHWIFSYSGLWCLDTSCESCLEGLKTFVREL